MATVDQFLQHLTESGLFSDFELRALLERQSAANLSEDARELRDELVRKDLLTPYQAEAIYQGHPQRLVIGDNYIIQDLIGSGGMGMVFRAKHRLMKKEVALKVLTSNAMNDEEAIARFYQEVVVASALDHRNIVQARDAGLSKDVHYLVMEFVRGNDLQQIVQREGPLAAGQAVNCIIQAAQGLAHAHKQRVIHRDIKPANLLLNDEGLIKILDMGLARINNPLGSVGDSHKGLTLPGSIMGTVDFMAPEQAADTTKADARSDIYSLGCTLFYLLTGNPVYDGSTAMMKLIAHRESAVPSLRSIRDDVSAELDQVFQKMVAKKADDRYQSMQEVINALEPCRTESEAQTRETVTQFLSPEVRGVLAGIQNTRTGKTSDTNVQQRTPGEPAKTAPKPETGMSQIEKDLFGDEASTREVKSPFADPPAVAEKPPKRSRTEAAPPDQTEVTQPSQGSSLAKLAQTDTGHTFLMLMVAVVAIGAGASVLLLDTAEMLLSLFVLAAVMVLILLFRPSARRLVITNPARPLTQSVEGAPRTGTSQRRAERETPAPKPSEPKPAESKSAAPDVEDLEESEQTLDAKLILSQREQKEILETFDVDAEDLTAGRAGMSEVTNPSASASKSITRRRLSESLPGDIPRPLIAPFEAAAAAKQRKRWASFLGIPAEVVNSVGTRMLLIPTGEFLMGSPQMEEGHSQDEKQHPVRLTQPYFLGAHPVTVGEFWKFVNDTGYRTDAENDPKGGYGFDASRGKLEQSPNFSWRDPGFAQSDNHPVVNITWNDAVSFCQWLSKRERITYRLPTEAEWEFACRAGTESRYFCGDDPEFLVKYGNVADGSTRAKFPQWPTITSFGGFIFTAPVESFAANAFGLHDMHGNVWEWCADRYGKNYYSESPLMDPLGPEKGDNRVLRGGSWMNAPLLTRSAKRLNQRPNQFFIANGFRLAATP
jgi:formylglycine-generating enzyme required for sulfatase activity